MAEVRSGAAGKPDDVPPTNKPLLVLAGVLLLIPIVALMWVSSYSRVDPKLWNIPFFFWYQFVWVFITAALTYAAHRLVLLARGQRAAGRPEERTALGRREDR